MAHKPAQKILHFYCYQCREYELKTSPHYAAQRQRFSRRRKREGEEREKNGNDN